MTPTQKAAMEQALEALEWIAAQKTGDMIQRKASEPQADLRAALAETAEPVADVQDILESLAVDIEAIGVMYRGSPSYEHDAHWMRKAAAKAVRNLASRLVAAPQPPAPAVELTDEELPPLPDTAYQLYYEWPDDEDGYGGSEVVDGDAYTTDQMREFARAAIAAHEAKKGNK